MAETKHFSSSSNTFSDAGKRSGIDLLDRSAVASLAVWTKKFAVPLHRVRETYLQKITATSHGELVLSVYKPGDDRSAVILSMKKGRSGISVTTVKPAALPQPNSIVQMARKYLAGRRICDAHALISPAGVLLFFAEAVAPPGASSEVIEDVMIKNAGPDTLVLDLGSPLPRMILAKRHTTVPERYREQVKDAFDGHEIFLESWCEWSEENTKTKRRICFTHPVVGYCPLLPSKDESFSEPSATPSSPVFLSAGTEEPGEKEGFTGLAILPAHLRKAIRTRLRFFSRRLQRQKADLPADSLIERLQNQSAGLKAILHLWPAGLHVWHVPPFAVEQYGLPLMFKLERGETPGKFLEKIHAEISVLKRRKQEIQHRMAVGIKASEDFRQAVNEAIAEVEKACENFIASRALSTDQGSDSSSLRQRVLERVLAAREMPALSRLCLLLGTEALSPTQNGQAGGKGSKVTAPLPWRAYTASTGEFIRVSRSATDADAMLRRMPSHHFWFHILDGEGSHVWLEKPRGRSEPLSTTFREAAILAIHHSSRGRSCEGEVRVASRADIEKRKDLPPGKVIVRRCRTLFIRYERQELIRILEGDSVRE